MTTPPDRPEVWIEGPDGAGDSPHRQEPDGPHHQRRWGIAIAAAVVLAALIVVPALTGGDSSDDAAPDPTHAPTTATSTLSASSTSSPSPPSAGTMRRPSPTTSEGPDAMRRTTVVDGRTFVVATLRAPTRITGTPPPVVNTAPTEASIGAADLPDADGWQVVGLQLSQDDDSAANGVIRYTPATGTSVTTPVPSLGSTGLLSFVATGDTALIRPYDTVQGYQVTRGSGARQLRGGLDHGGPIFPGPRPGTVWVTRGSQTQVTALELMDVGGAGADSTITLPPALTPHGRFGLTPDGAGHVLATGTGGTYLITADGVRLITHGRVLAAGPTAFLVWECDEAGACTAAVIDRESSERHALPQFTPVPGMTQGVISPDGMIAVSVVMDGSGSFVRIHLGSGHVDRLPGTRAGAARVPGSARGVVAFTPDSRYVLLNTNRGIVPIDTATRAEYQPLPIHSVVAFAITTDPGAASGGERQGRHTATRAGSAPPPMTPPL